jgi:glycogen synthase
MPPETGWGGIGTYVAALGPALVAAGAEVHVLSVVPGQAPSDRVVAGVVVHRRDLRRPPGVGRVSRLPEAWERVTLAAAVRRELRTLDFAPDVIEAPEWRAEGLALARSRRVPVVVRLHSAAEQLFPYSGRAGLDSRLAVWLERRSVAGADLVVSTPANLAELGARLSGGGARLPAMRAVNLPVPVPDGALPPSGGTGGPRVAFVGRLERRKGPETLVAAARAVLDAVPAARFAFVGADTGVPGGGSYADSLRTQARRLGVEHALEIVGHRPHAEAMAELRRAAMCAFPARHETFGYGAAEAAVAGRPVIASRIPPFVSLLGDAAVLVDADDIDRWAQAIIGLLGDPARAQRLGAAAAQRVGDRCSPERIAAEMLGVYAEARALGRGRLHDGRTTRQGGTRWRRARANTPVS